MSDTFDHECDAYDQFVNMGEELECLDTTGDWDYLTRNPLHYHQKYNFLCIKIKTKNEDGAYLIETIDGNFWVPKSLCRELNEEKGTIWIWNKFEPQILRDENGYTIPTR